MFMHVRAATVTWNYTWQRSLHQLHRHCIKTSSLHQLVKHVQYDIGPQKIHFYIQGSFLTKTNAYQECISMKRKWQGRVNFQSSILVDSMVIRKCILRSFILHLIPQDRYNIWIIRLLFCTSCKFLYVEQHTSTCLKPLAAQLFNGASCAQIKDKY